MDNGMQTRLQTVRLTFTCTQVTFTIPTFLADQPERAARSASILDLSQSFSICSFLRMACSSVLRASFDSGDIGARLSVQVFAQDQHWGHMRQSKDLARSCHEKNRSCARNHTRLHENTACDGTLFVNWYFLCLSSSIVTCTVTVPIHYA